MTSPITVVMPVSALPSHPEIDIIKQAIASVQFWLPDSELLLTFDGVREEQESRRAAYEEAIRRILWRADHHWGNVCPFIFDEHRHQSGMLKAVIDEIRTPLLMYVESDTPIVIDEPIDWAAITEFILSGQSNLVRLHHEAHVHPEHAHLMVGQDGPLFARTVQWSQRPHVASVAYYRRLLDSYFSENSRAFLEDRLYGVVENAWRQDGMQGYMQHRLHLYTPNDTNIQRSWHADGRAGEPKYDDSQVW